MDAPTIQILITSITTIAVAWIGLQQYREKVKRDRAVARIEAAAKRSETTCEMMETQVGTITKAMNPEDFKHP